MNLANKLTILRVILVPVFLIFLFLDSLPYNYLLALVAFAAAAVTDLLDGKIARRSGTVTTFGKFLDPLADKILVCSALAAFIELGLSYSIAVILVVARDFIVSGIRLVALSEGGKVVDANIWGKIKTTIQVAYIIAALLLAEVAGYFSSAADGIKLGLRLASLVVAAITVATGIIYIRDNAAYLKEGGRSK